MNEQHALIQIGSVYLHAFKIEAVNLDTVVAPLETVDSENAYPLEIIMDSGRVYEFLSTKDEFEALMKMLGTVYGG